MLWTALAGVRSAKTCQLSALRMTQDVECLCTTMYKLAPGLLSVSQLRLALVVPHALWNMIFCDCTRLKLMLKTLT